jgi:hypothetical protein
MKEPGGTRESGTPGHHLFLGNIGRGHLPIGICEVRTDDGLTQRVLGADGYRCLREPRNFRLAVVHEYHPLFVVEFSVARRLVRTTDHLSSVLTELPLNADQYRPRGPLLTERIDRRRIRCSIRSALTVSEVRKSRRCPANVHRRAWLTLLQSKLGSSAPAYWSHQSPRTPSSASPRSRLLRPLPRAS